MKKQVMMFVLSFFFTVFSCSTFCEHCFFSDLASVGSFAIRAINYESLVFHNHVYKKIPKVREIEKTLYNKVVFKTPLTVFYPEKEGKSPLVVISHGWGDDKKSQASLAQYLASRGYIAVIFSARYEYRHRPEDFVTAFEQAFLLIEKAMKNKNSLLFQKIDAEKTVVIGHSMGGTAALHYALMNPSLTLVIALHPYNGASKVIEKIGGKNEQLGADLSHMQSATMIFTGSKDKIAYPKKTFEFCKNINSSIPFSFFSVRGAKHQHPIDKYGNPVNGSFAPKKHAVYRALIFSWLELFLNNNSVPAQSLYLDKNQLGVLSKYLESTDETVYPPFLLQNIPNTAASPL